MRNRGWSGWPGSGGTDGFTLGRDRLVQVFAPLGVIVALQERAAEVGQEQGAERGAWVQLFDCQPPDVNGEVDIRLIRVRSNRMRR